MKKFAHLLGYLLRRQFAWVILFWILVLLFVLLIEWEAGATIVIAILGVLSLIIVGRVHDHLDGGGSVLVTRPIGRYQLIKAELVFLFGVLVLPALTGVFVILASYDAGAAAYWTTLTVLAFAVSQLMLWYVAGKLSNSPFGAFMLLLLCYLPIMLLWSVVEYCNQHATFDFTVFIVLGISGFSSLWLIVVPFSRQIKVVLFVSAAVVLLSVMSGVRWDRSEPFEDEAKQSVEPSRKGGVSVEFAAVPPTGGDPMRDSYWDFFKISSERPDEILVPINVLGSPFSSSRSEPYRYYLWEQPRALMLGDLVLRNLPSGCDLRGFQPLVRDVAKMVHAEPVEVEVSEEEKFVLLGQKLRLVPGGVIPLKEGESGQAEGYRLRVSKLVFEETKLSVKIGMTWVSDSLANLHSRTRKMAWVLYSPSSQRAVLLSGKKLYQRIGFEPALMKRQRLTLDFPLPETFTDGDELELYPFFLKEGEFLKFEVSVPPGRYSVQ